MNHICFIICIRILFILYLFLFIDLSCVVHLTQSVLTAPGRPPTVVPVATAANSVLVFEDPLPETAAALDEAIARQCVQLESVSVHSPQVFCTIRVRNISFEKKIFLRVTHDGWATHTDVPASFYSASADGRSDRFLVRAFRCRNKLFFSSYIMIKCMLNLSAFS
jgi:hypothetical protein